MRTITLKLLDDCPVRVNMLTVGEGKRRGLALGGGADEAVLEMGAE